MLVAGISRKIRKNVEGHPSNEPVVEKRKLVVVFIDLPECLVRDDIPLHHYLANKPHVGIGVAFCPSDWVVVDSMDKLAGLRNVFSNVHSILVLLPVLRERVFWLVSPLLPYPERPLERRVELLHGALA